MHTNVTTAYDATMRRVILAIIALAHAACGSTETTGSRVAVGSGGRVGVGGITSASGSGGSDGGGPTTGGATSTGGGPATTGTPAFGKCVSSSDCAPGLTCLDPALTGGIGYCTQQGCQSNADCTAFPDSGTIQPICGQTAFPSAPCLLLGCYGEQCPSGMNCLGAGGPAVFFCTY